MSRRLKLSIFRHNPRDPKSVPRLVDYELDEQPGMTLFIALNAIRDTQAPDLNFDFVCRAGVCGSCAMVIDGRPGLACRTLTSTLPASFSLYPLPVFRLVADLSVDVGSWMRELAERLQAHQHGAVSLVSRCEKLGLVERRPGRDDRRAVEVHLTAAGEALVARIAARHRDELRSLQELLGGVFGRLH